MAKGNWADFWFVVYVYVSFSLPVLKSFVTSCNLDSPKVSPWERKKKNPCQKGPTREKYQLESHIERERESTLLY